MERSAEHKRFFFEAFKIVRMLCPGLHRLRLELGDIIEHCKEKNRRLKQYLRDCHARGIVPLMFDPRMRQLLSYDVLNHHALDLGGEFTDEETSRCVD